MNTPTIELAEQMRTLEDFINVEQLSMTTAPTEYNPNMTDAWAKTATHYNCIFTSGQHKRTLRTHFSQGSAHTEPPTLDSVLDCLASDASTVENENSFEDFCGELGYDPDSRQAEKLYKTIRREAAKLKAFLGEVAYDDLLWKTERE